MTKPFGRPPLPDDVTRYEILSVRLSIREKALLCRAAKECDLKISALVRMLVKSWLEEFEREVNSDADAVNE